MLAGKEIAAPCPKCQAARNARAEQARIEAEQRARSRAVAVLLNAADIPARFQGRTFENFRVTLPAQKRVLNVCRSYARDFEDRLKHGGGLIFTGKPGTGKTHLACAIAAQITATGRSVIFTTVIKAIRRVKETYSSGSKFSERDILNAMVKPDLLILDEVGMQRGTDHERVILTEIISDRYAELRPTVLISNLTAKEIATYIGERGMSRMEEGGGVTLAFDWGSYRKEAASDDRLPWPDPAPVDPAAILKEWGGA